MRAKLLVAFTAAAFGVVLGAVGVSVLHAQAKPPAYYVADFELSDPETIKIYRDRFNATMTPFGGRFIARAGNVAKLEGDAPKGRFILIVFDNMEKALAWYNSPAYAEIRTFRQKSGKTNAFIIEGTND